MDRNAVFVVLGVVLILLSLAGKVIAQWFRVDITEKPVPRTVVGVLGAVILVVGLTPVWPWKIGSPVPAATIARPMNAAVVERTVVVGGTLRNVGTGAHAWLVVNPLGEVGWWPQGGPLVLRPDRSWEQPVYLGGKPGQRFVIAVVLASDEAQVAFSKYLQDAAAANSYPGKPLPPGTSVLASVEVTLDPGLPR